MNQEQVNNYLDLTPEHFEFANKQGRIYDKKIETKSVGYFADALSRFRKNKASVVAAFIILLIVIYAITIPLIFNGPQNNAMDPFYKSNPSRMIWFKENLGILDGGMDFDKNENAIIQEYAKAVGAEYDGTTVLPISAIFDSEYNPVIKVNSIQEIKQGFNVNTIYNARIDQYLTFGFIERYLTDDQYDSIVAWQEKTGKQVLYPLIEVNEYSFYKGASSAGIVDENYWYKVTGKGVPVRVEKSTNANGEVVENVVQLKYSDDLVLEDNYMRDADGNLVYRKFVGNSAGSQYKVRVLYYNYYQYTYGTTPDYLFGTDLQGYDLAVRMAEGIQLSLILAVCVSLINFVIGAIYGAVEGYYGGTADLIMERVKDILSGIPLIVAATLFQIYLAKLPEVGPVGSLIFAFIVTGWIGTSSRVRSQFYRFKHQEYVLAARTLGARDRRIIWKHIFPNTLGTIITSSVLVIPSVIFSESMLSFLGIMSLGNADGTSLGTLLSDASKDWVDRPHLMLWPALVISLLMICFNLFGNGLRDAFNPSLRGVEE